MTLLEVKQFSKRFEVHHTGRTVMAFEHLSFQLEAGAFLLVSGPNGVGKSTLLRTLYRSYLPSGGEAWYDSRLGRVNLARAADVDIAWLRREEIGFVTQFLRPRPRVSAQEIVAEPALMASNHQGDAAQARREAGRLLEAFDLKPELWGAYPSTFSGGEQQKVNLARALIRPRRLLFLDEPTASLDARTREALVGRLAALKREGVAMIGVFHHPEDVSHLVDQELHLEAASYVAE